MMNPNQPVSSLDQIVRLKWELEAKQHILDLRQLQIEALVEKVNKLSIKVFNGRTYNANCR